MTAAGFISFLRELDSQKGGQLRPVQLNAVFNDLNLRRFLEFFLTNTKKDKNFVSDEELKIFQRLKAEGRVIQDPEDRRLKIQEQQRMSAQNERDSSNGYVDDAVTLDWYKDRLDSTRERLEKLKLLEQRLAKLCKQRQQADKKRLENQSALMAKQKGELKHTQIQLMGLDIRFRDCSTKLSQILDRFKPMLRDQSLFRSLFFCVTSSGQCISSAAEALRQLHVFRQQLQESAEDRVRADASGGGASDEEELGRLREALYVTFSEKYTEEVRQADAKARQSRIRELQRNATERKFLKISAKMEEASVVSLRRKIKSYMEGPLLQDAVACAELLIVKALQTRCQRNADRVAFYRAKENKLLICLNNKHNALALLERFISAENQHVKQEGLEPLTRIQKLMCDWAAWRNECEGRIEEITATKRAVAKVADADNHRDVGDSVEDAFTGGINDLKRARSVLELYRMHTKSAELFRHLSSGVPELDRTIAQYDHRLTSIEKTLLNYIVAYEKKKATS